MRSGYKTAWWLLAAAFALSAALPTARAQKPQPPTDQKAQVKKLFAEGSALYAKNKFREAIEVFAKAYAIWKNRKIMLNIAICHAELGEHAKAVESLEEALKGASEEEIKAIRAKMPKVLKKSEQQVAVLTVVMPDPFAEIIIDTQSVGRSPVTKALDSGPHVVEIRLSGQVKVKKIINLTPGQKETWKLDAWPARAPAIRPRPGTPETPTTEKKSFFKKYARLPYYYLLGAAGLTLVSGITIIGTGAMAKKYHDDYYSNPTWSARNKGIKYRDATNAMIGITVAAAVATGVLALFTDFKTFNRLFKKKEKAGSARLTPFVGPGRAGVVLMGGL